MTPKISIIIPVYNAEKTLSRCIDSVLMQSLKDFELILIDDGSKDKSPSICDSYAHNDSRIIVIHKQNEGVSRARNSGLDIASGVWVTFVDSDDEVLNDFFDQAIKFEHSDLIVCGYESISNINKDKNEVLLQQYEYKIEELTQFFNKHINDKVLTAPWCKLFKREIINSNNIRFKPNISYGEDTIFVAEYMQYVTNIVYSGAISYRYYCPDATPTALRYKVTPQCATEYATTYWRLFHKLAPKPFREDQTCMGRFFSMEIFCLINKEYRKDRKLWLDNDYIHKIKAESHLTIAQRLWYACATKLPYGVYSVFLKVWLLINNFKEKLN